MMIRSLPRWTVAVILILGVAGVGDAGQRALLIGINDYQYGDDVWDLRGCVNDVQMTRQMLLERFGFQPGDIVVLVDGQATRNAIVATIEDWLIAGTGPEDVAYLHFSGHGSQVADEDGDEPDGFDEILCPTDLKPTDRATMLLDDDLRRLIERIPAGSLTTVLDACHSGTGTRDLSLSRPRYLPLGEQNVAAPSGARGLDPDATQALVTSFFALRDPSSPSAMEATRAASRAHVTISGCRADQTSADAWIRDGFYAGALTYNLVANARRAPVGTTYGELLESVRRDMAGRYYQTPQIEGHAEAPLLAAGSASLVAPAIGNAVVTVVRGDRVRIGVGWASGVTPGSVFVIHAAGSLRPSDPAEELHVDHVEQSWSEGPLPTGARVAAGDHAERRSHGVSLEPLRVRLDGPDADLAAAVRQSLRAMDFVRVASADQHFDVRLSVQTQTLGVVGTLLFDGVPRAGEEAPTVPALVERLRPHLANAYVIARLAALQNPEASFGLSLTGRSEDAEGKVIHARIGDEVGLRFTADRDCYVTLLNVGTSGKISVLFPNQFQPDARVYAGQVLETGEPGPMPFRIRAANPPGRELVLAVATLKPLDIRKLVSPTPAAGARALDPGGQVADQLVRDVAAVYTESPAPSQVPTTGQVLLPSTGWTSDCVIVDTY